MSALLSSEKTALPLKQTDACSAPASASQLLSVQHLLLVVVGKLALQKKKGKREPILGPASASFGGAMRVRVVLLAALANLATGNCAPGCLGIK